MPQYPYFPTNNDLAQAGPNITLTAATSLTVTDAGTGIFSTGQLTNIGNKGVNVTVDVGTLSGTGGVTVGVLNYDSASKTYNAGLTSSLISSTGITLLTLYPGVASVSDVSVSGHLSQFYEVTATVSGSATITGTLGICLLV